MAAINAASVSLPKSPSPLSPRIFPRVGISKILRQFHFNEQQLFLTNNIILSHSQKEPSQLNFPPDDQYAPRGCDVLAEALQQEGVNHVFGYPGNSSLEMLEALRRRTTIRNVLDRHEQGSIFSAEGYARALGVPGVCITTSGPSVTNIISGLANAYKDSVPLVVITGQIHSHLMGTDALQDTPVVELTRPITKHNYLVLDVEEIPRIVKEAFFIAKSGRPGPVLIDIPKDIQLQRTVPNWDQPMSWLGEDLPRLPKPPSKMVLEKILRMISLSKCPVLYVGGGCLNSTHELRRFVELTGIPVASSMMALGCYPCSDEELSLQMLGVYGTTHANYAVGRCDLLLAFGVKFHSYATGKLENFASRAKIVHINIDQAEIGKKKQVDVSVCTDIKLALEGMNLILEETTERVDFSTWRKEIKEHKSRISSYPILSTTSTNDEEDVIHPWYAIQVLDELTNGNAIICTGAGEHQIYATQFYTHKHPRHLLIPGGFGAMGFGLPAAIGAAIARPDAVVVDIDGDGSFLMNVQELATARAENLNVKIVIFNNQHFGMVAEWEDSFCNSDRAHSYLGNPSKPSQIFPDMLKFAEACDVPAVRVTRKKFLRGAMQMMLDTPGPYLLDVILPLGGHALLTIAKEVV